MRQAVDPPARPPPGPAVRRLARSLLAGPGMNRLAAALTSLCLLVDVAWLARSAGLAANTFAWGSDDGAEVIRRPGLGALAVELGERSPALFLGVMVALALAWIDAWRWGGRAPGTRLGALLAFAMAASLLTLGPLFWLAPELHYVWTPHSWARTSTVAASAALAVFVLAAVAFADGRPSASAIVIALLARARVGGGAARAPSLQLLPLRAHAPDGQPPLDARPLRGAAPDRAQSGRASVAMSPRCRAKSEAISARASSSSRRPRTGLR